MIELDAVTYSYPRTPQPALRDVRLSIPAGQFCAIVGANGAGKSTLCYLLAGFAPHFFKGELSGAVRVAGHDVARTPLAEMAADVGLVFANPFNQITGARFTVREEVAFGLENMGTPRDEMLARTAAALATTGLSDLAERSPYALSGGQQQRLAIASILVMRPRLLVLDEPTSQLDPVGTQEIFSVLEELVRQGETTVVLVSYKLEWVGQHADRVVVLDNGRILADGPPRDILTDDDLAASSTRYTQAARRARAEGLAPAQGLLPVTLDEAISFFENAGEAA
jgi:energy-coupling factor transport system ATP-binding protein